MLRGVRRLQRGRVRRGRLRPGQAVNSLGPRLSRCRLRFSASSGRRVTLSGHSAAHAVSHAFRASFAERGSVSSVMWHSTAQHVYSREEWQLNGHPVALRGGTGWEVRPPQATSQQREPLTMLLALPTVWWSSQIDSMGGLEALGQCPQIHVACWYTLARGGITHRSSWVSGPTKNNP